MSTKLKKVLVSLLVLVLITAFIPVSADSSLAPYYGREKLAEMNNGENLVGAYNAICQGVKYRTSKISIGSYRISIEEMKMVINIFRFDHPEYYWFPTSYSYGYYKGTSIASSVTFSYLTGFNDYAFELNVKKLLSAANGKTTEFDKALAIHDALVKHIVYDATAPNAHNAYGAIVEGAAVCEGYAEAYQYLLQRIGIQAYSVTGTSKGNPHEWNLVRIDGNYYYTDVTWDDPTIGGVQENTKPVFHAYFNIGTHQISEDHQIEDEYNILPNCTSAHLCEKHTAISEYTIDSVAAAFKYNLGQYTADIYFTGTNDNFDDWWYDNYYSVLTKIGAWGSIAWISDGHEHFITVTQQPNIYSAELNITEPLGNLSPDFEVISNESHKYIGMVSWYCGDTELSESDVFEVGKTYTAKIEFDVCFGYKFLSNTIFKVNGNNTDCYGEIFERVIEFTVTSAFGDRTGDGVLNSADLIEFKKMLLSSKFSTDCDMNGDGDVNLLDFVRLKKFIAGSDVKLGQ